MLISAVSPGLAQAATDHLKKFDIQTPFSINNQQYFRTPNRELTDPGDSGSVQYELSTLTQRYMQPEPSAIPEQDITEEIGRAHV